MTEERLHLLTFGEMLWDFLPEGLFAGGAPFNVAYHLRQQGADVKLISAVGRDLLGDELLRRIRHWPLPTDTICRHQGLPTGYVVAELGARGDAHYTIAPSVAWDQIMVGEDALRAAVGTQALVFGSLAQRSAFNRAALERLLNVLPPTAWRVFDVNLRPPHDDLALVRELAAATTLLKLNAAEAARLAGAAAEVPGEEEAHARTLADATRCPIICITAGERGAGLLRHDQWHWERGQEVVVADTVGAGDSFLATLLMHLLPGRLSDAACLARACRVGEWVAGRRGATPPYDATTPR